MKRKTIPRSLPHELLRHLRASQILRPGDRIAVAVSGGADSVALLHLLLALRAELGILLSVAHFNHHLRARSSDADELFVRKLAARHELPFQLAHADVAKSAKQDKRNLEDAARRARYSFFVKLVTRQGVSRVAVAHTADDQAETVLAHILRGTGIAGLGGIHPVTEHVFRPLLEFRRADLRSYLRARRQSWREDRTNRDTTKTRARIRRTLLPLLERRFQPLVVRHLCTLASLARDDERYLEQQARQRLAAISDTRGATLRVLAKDLLTDPAIQSPIFPAIRGRIVRQIVQSVKQAPGQLNAPHVDAVLKLAEHGESGKSLRLPGGVEVRRQGTALLFLPRAPAAGTNDAAQANQQYRYKIDLSRGVASVSIPQLRCAFRFTPIDCPAQTGETGLSGAVVDREALGTSLVLRNWLPGDKFCPGGHRSAQKLKRLLSKKQLERWERAGWPVLATHDGEIVWVRGFPVAARFAPNDRTRAGILVAEERIS